MRWIAPLAWAVLTAALGCAPAFAEKRVVLTIGNDRYPNLPANRQLQKAVNDADAVGDAFASLGFEVIRGHNLGRQGVIDRLAELTARVGPGDTVALFYAGHGVAIGGINYLIPSDVPAVTPDAESRVRGASISEPDIMAEIQAKGVRVALLVIDACRDNPFPRSGTRSIGNGRGLSDAKPARGVFTIYSAGIGQTALDRLENDDKNRNSVFTRIFVKELIRPGLHLGDLAVEVREKVAELALLAKNENGEKEPHEQTPAYYDQTVGGRVYLAARNIAVEPAKPPAVVAPAPDPAGLAWIATQATTSIAVLEDFIRQFGATVYASMARARIEELKKSQAALAPPPPPAAKPLPPAPPPAQPTSSAGCSEAAAHWGRSATAATAAMFEEHARLYPNCGFAALALSRLAASRAISGATQANAALPQPAPAPSAPVARPTTAACKDAADHWGKTAVAGTSAAFQDHLKLYANCAFAELARTRLRAASSVGR